MDRTVKRIIEIDREAEKYRREAEEERKREAKELEQMLIEMEGSFVNGLYGEVRGIEKKILEEAEREAEKIVSDREASIAAMEKIYERESCRVVKTLTEEILEKVKGG